MEPRKDATGVLLYKGLCIGRLNSIELAEETHAKGEFADKTIKVLVFEFQEHKLNADDPDRFYVRREKIVGTLTTDKKVRSAKDIAQNINEMWFRIKHILDTCKPQPTFRDIATIPDDIAEEFINLPVDGEVDDRIADFNKFFEFVVNFANGNETVPAMYKDANGEGQLMWIKLLPEHPDYNRYAIPSWVKGGFVEATSLNAEGRPVAPKILEIRPNESLELVVKAKNAPAQGGTSGLPAGAAAADQSTVDYLRGLHGIKQ